MWKIISLGFGIRHWYDKFFFSSMWVYALIAVSMFVFKTSLPYSFGDCLMFLQMIWFFILTVVALYKINKGK